MRQNRARNIFLTAAMACIAAAPVVDLVPMPASAQQKTSPSRKRKAKAGQSGQRKPETSADVKRQQEATQKEIRQTEAQIKENERSVKTGLSELGKLEGDIAASKNRIGVTTKQLNALNGQITGLEKSISTNEAELTRMREEYLKALKKMRLSRKKNSGLAFVFASENFNQALRRMRYLRQFSEWKDRQSDAISRKNDELKSEKYKLGKARNEQGAALKRQQTEQAALSKQYARQDALVADLKKNGDVLRTHLSKKQAEANQLKNRIASLIAEEERKAAEERERQEAARKAEEERLAREEAARIAAQKEAEEKAAREAELLAQNEAQRKADSKKKSDADKKAEAKKKKEEQKKADEQKKKEEKERKRKQKKSQDKKKEPEKAAPKEYADARKRTPRAEASGSGNAGASVGNGNFGGMKGKLPLPVSGAFKVTSRFGRQSLPDLPDVMYDNPGIDAEVSPGASALAVYGGKVSGVYMIPGYNTVVIVNHGNYYTVYGNIAAAAVKVGDKVNAGQGLGRLAADEDDSSHSSIHFEVWRNRDKLNPMEWIR